MRATTPRSSHGPWKPAANRADPVAILEAQGRSRIQDLLPVRTARMAASAFAFLRGAAAVMAADLATTPTTGLLVQAAGDCHLANFGTFRSAEGAAVFDLNDFDETLPAPFEWDLKRLCTSLVLAGRDEKLPGKACRALALNAAASYRTHMATLAPAPPLEQWSTRIDLPEAIAAIADPKLRGRETTRLNSALRAAEGTYDLIAQVNGQWRFKIKPPNMWPLPDEDGSIRALFVRYAETLPVERRALLARYELVDFAFKVVGVGSVGTFCAVALCVNADGQALVLQLKQAGRSVLEPHVIPSAYPHQGERVVAGQRILQATPDPFLGWTADPAEARFFYVRQLKDRSLAAIGTDLSGALPFYATLCGRTLARAHTRSGDPASIAGYMGTNDTLDNALADFAVAYADQSEADWQALLAAVKAGRMVAGGLDTNHTGTKADPILSPTPSPRL